MTVEGRVAIVTGSGQGIGFGIATRLARSGARVVVNDISQESASAAASALVDQGFEAVPFAADVSDAHGASALIEHAVATFGGLDILVNNAGIGRDKSLLKLDPDDWDAVLRVNLRGPFLCSQKAFSVMKPQGHGRIIHIGSRAWLGGFGQSSYSASKGGLISLSRTIALEGARVGVTSNVVVPALVGTPLFNSLDDDTRARLSKTVPMGRVGTPDDIAWAVSFYAADEASYITGQHVYVCGGRSLGSAE